MLRQARCHPPTNRPDLFRAGFYPPSILDGVVLKELPSGRIRPEAFIFQGRGVPCQFESHFGKS